MVADVYKCSVIEVQRTVSPRDFDRAIIASRAEKLYRDQLERDRKFRNGQ